MWQKPLFYFTSTQRSFQCNTLLRTEKLVVYEGVFLAHTEKLDLIHSLLEKELALYQSWLSLITQIEDSISHNARQQAQDASMQVPEVAKEVATLREAITDHIADFSKDAHLFDHDKSTLLSVFTLQENITLLQNKVGKRVGSLSQAAQAQIVDEHVAQKVQLSVDHSLDVLQMLSKKRSVE